VLGRLIAFTRIGCEGLPPRDRRRVQIANLGSTIGGGLCALFVIGYLVAGRKFWIGSAINLAGLVMFSISMALNRRGYDRIGRVSFVIEANALIFAISRMLGPAAGFQYYFFAFVPATLLIFDPRSLLAIVCAVGSFIEFADIQYAMSPDDAWIRVSSAQLLPTGIFSAGAAVMTITLIVFSFYLDSTQSEELLAVEHARSERLLLNVLPAPISARLKQGEEPIADRFEEVGVLFADLVGFTPLAATMTPEQVVVLLNRVFSRWDELGAPRGLEKIKTIGDAYMVACGLPSPHGSVAAILAETALAMRDSLTELNRELGQQLDVRIGIHAGPVVAGVIGKQKFSYDLWGDTVNTASRMESTAPPGGIQVTESIVRVLDGKYRFESRGKISVKGKGEMETWLLMGTVFSS
jgi:class 3 adenylate cyclase